MKVGVLDFRQSRKHKGNNSTDKGSFPLGGSYFCTEISCVQGDGEEPLGHVNLVSCRQTWLTLVKIWITSLRLERSRLQVRKRMNILRYVFQSRVTTSADAEGNKHRRSLRSKSASSVLTYNTNCHIDLIDLRCCFFIRFSIGFTHVYI